MHYANAVITEYENYDYVNIAVFNRIIIDDLPKGKIIPKDKSEITENEQAALASEVARVSQYRARHKIFDIAMLNDWQYFVTFTFNDKIQDAHDYKGTIEKVKKWCQNAVQRKGMRYLLVPELHPTSGRIHLHGLLAFQSNIPLEFSGHYDKALRPIYNCPFWKYGFSTVVRLDFNTQDRIAKYITKYITKDLDKITGNYYYAGGHNLKRFVDKSYINIDFDDFDAPEFVIAGGMKVKYLYVTKEKLLNMQFIVDNNIEF